MAESKVADFTPENRRGAWRCPWTSADECAMAAEREVAGTDEPPPSCVDHPDDRAVRFLMEGR